MKAFKHPDAMGICEMWDAQNRTRSTEEAHAKPSRIMQLCGTSHAIEAASHEKTRNLFGAAESMP
jgi:hypothetical protein